MGKFSQLFQKAGGKQVLKQYLRAHVLLFAAAQTVLNGFSKKSLEVVRSAVSNRIVRKLKKKNRKFISQFVPSGKDRHSSDKVWVCWLQGMENAPALVQRYEMTGAILASILSLGSLDVLLGVIMAGVLRKKK